jgi:hypothetical protein
MLDAIAQPLEQRHSRCKARRIPGRRYGRRRTGRAPVGELDPVVGQHDVDAVRRGQHQIAQELRSLYLACTLHKLGKGEFAGAVDA